MRKVLFESPSLVVVALVCSAVTLQSRAASVEAYSSVEAGFANTCLLGSVFLPGPGHAFSGTFGAPTPGETFQSCGFSASSGAANPSAAAGPVNATWSASASDAHGYSFTGQSSARANYGVFGAAASASISGPFYTGGSLGNSAAAYGVMSDTIVINSPGHAAQTAGFLKLKFSIDGTLNAGTDTHAPSGANALLGVRLGPVFDAPFNATAFAGQQGTLTRPAPGFVTGIGTVSGTTSVTTGAMEFFYGVPTELQTGLLAQVKPATLGVVPGHAEASFMTTAKVTGVEVFDGAGNSVSDFTIDAQSGAHYGPNGIIAVPEPAGIWLVVVGLVTMVACRRHHLVRRCPCAPISVRRANVRRSSP